MEARLFLNPQNVVGDVTEGVLAQGYKALTRCTLNFICNLYQMANDVSLSL